MKDDMTIMNILLGCVLIILVFVLTCNSVMISRRNELLDQIYNAMVSFREEACSLNDNCNSLLKEIESGNDKCTLLADRIVNLENLIGQLDKKADELHAENETLMNTKHELLNCNRRLSDEAFTLRKDVQHEKDTLRQLKNQTDSMKGLKAGLEIALNSILAEEIPFLSKPISQLDFMSAVEHYLKYDGIIYVGDLVSLSEERIISINGIGNTTLERIKKRLEDNGVRLGMDLIRVNNHWYRKKDCQITD